MISYNALSRMCIWLSRIGCCRGFGVQSPWAYSFVRYVINEHYPYYAYGALGSIFRSITVSERKMGEFYLRLANYVQPSDVFLLFSSDDSFGDMRRKYLASGCRRCIFTELKKDEVPTRRGTSSAIILCCSSSLVSLDMLEKTVKEGEKGDIIIVEDIKKNGVSRQMWKELTTRLDGVLMFDLFYCGIIYIDADRYKQHFKINF